MTGLSSEYLAVRINISSNNRSNPATIRNPAAVEFKISPSQNAAAIDRNRSMTDATKITMTTLIRVLKNLDNASAILSFD